MTEDQKDPDKPLSEVSQNPFLRRHIERRAERRPQKTGGVLLSVAVAIVMFIGLTVWYTDVSNVHVLRKNPSLSEVRVLTETDAVHRLALRCHDAYPQLAKSASSYWAELEEVDLTAPDAGIRQADLFTKLLALDSNSPSALVGLLRLDLSGIPTLVKEEERAGLIDALDRFAPETAGLEALRAAAGFVPEINDSLDTPRVDDY